MSLRVINNNIAFDLQSFYNSSTSTTTTTALSILLLPTEILLYIFTFFIYHEAIPLSRSCKLFYNIFENTEDLWAYYRKYVYWKMQNDRLSKLDFLKNFSTRNMKQNLSDKEYMLDYHTGCIFIIYLFDDEAREDKPERHIIIFCREKNFQVSVMEEMITYGLNSVEVIMKIGPTRRASKTLFLMNDVLGLHLSVLSENTKKIEYYEKIQSLLNAEFKNESIASFDFFLNTLSLVIITRYLKIPFEFYSFSVSGFKFIPKCKELVFREMNELSEDVLNIFSLGGGNANNVK